MPKCAVASCAMSSGISIQNWLMFIQGIHIHWYVCHLLTSIRGLTLSTKFSMVQWLLNFWLRLCSPIGSCSQPHSRRLVSIPRLSLSLSLSLRRQLSIKVFSMAAFVFFALIPRVLCNGRGWNRISSNISSKRVWGRLHPHSIKR